MSSVTAPNAETVPLTAEQRTVLQAIYDHFHAQAAWPKLITIARQMRNAHKWDAAAIVQSLPESVIVQPQQGMRPVADDDLRLRLLGIHACAGGAEDTTRFARLLHWFAERDAAYEPPPDSDTDMPTVTSREIAEYLDLGRDDQLALKRLRVMLGLDHWSTSTSEVPGGWQVRLGEDIWRFSEVQTALDCVAAREAWVMQGRSALPVAVNASPLAVYYHAQLRTDETPSGEHVQFDLSAEALELQILAPYREGRALVIRGAVIQTTDVIRIRIVRTNRPSADILQRTRSLLGTFIDAAAGDMGVVARYSVDVTEEFVTEPPGQSPAPSGALLVQPTPEVASPLYVDQQVIDAIRARAGQSRFDVTKLLKLIDELNDNYTRDNAYGAHAVLRGLVDHVPPILGCADFNAVASNYSWTRTDKRYIKRLADFRAQGDDALHRQISEEPDLLDLDDMPPSRYVERLLQECAAHL